VKISAVETIRLGEFPNLLWLHIHTDEGLTGLGETFFGPRAVEAHIHETVAPLLLGKPALQMDRHARTLQTQYLGFSGTGVEMRAASAVDIALWDLFGQATGQPLYQCLGGLSHERVRIYNTCAGYRYIRSAEGQKTDNWGIDAKAEGPYEDLDAFLHRADDDSNDHNDIWQDGAVLVDLGEPEWAAYFAAFEQQLVPTDDLGNPKPGAQTI